MAYIGIAALAASVIRTQEKNEPEPGQSRTIKAGVIVAYGSDGIHNYYIIYKADKKQEVAFPNVLGHLTRIAVNPPSLEAYTERYERELQTREISPSESEIQYDRNSQMAAKTYVFCSSDRLVTELRMLDTDLYREFRFVEF